MCVHRPTVIQEIFTATLNTQDYVRFCSLHKANRYAYLVYKELFSSTANESLFFIAFFLYNNQSK